MKESEIKQVNQEAVENKDTAPFAPIRNHENEAKQDPAEQKEDMLFVAGMWDFLKGIQKEGSPGYKLAEKYGNNLKEQMGYDLNNPEQYDKDVKEVQEKWDSKHSAVNTEKNPSAVTPVVVRMTNTVPVFGAPVEEFELGTMSRMDLKKNNDQINRLYNILDSKDHWYRGSSENFRELMKDLKKLKSLSRELMELRADHNSITDPGQLEAKRKKELDVYKEYMEQSRIVMERSDIYIEGKKNNINSSYARARFEAVTELKNIISANRNSVEKAFTKETAMRTARIANKRINERQRRIETEKLMTWYREKYSKYALSPGSDNNRKVFMGNNYTDADLDAVKQNTSFSVNRSAAHSVSIFALMCEKDQRGRNKYSIEDIMDPDKLQAEKQEMFKKVIGRMTGGSKEDKEWLAQKMVRGYEEGNAAITRLLSRVDFKNPDYIFTDEFTRASMLSGIMSDVWQETKWVKEEIAAEINKNAGPDKKKMTFEEYRDETGRQRGYLDQLGVNVQRLSEMVERMNNSTEMFGYYSSQVVPYSYTVNVLKNDFARKAMECQGKPFDQWFSVKEGALGKCFLGASIDKFSELGLSKEQFNEMLPSFLNGSAFSKIGYVYNPDNPDKQVVINGTIDREMIISDMEMSKLSDDEILRRIDNQISYFDSLKKTSGREVREYIGKAVKGMNYLSGFAFSPQDMKPDEIEKAGQCIKDIFSCHVAAELSKTGLKGQALKEQVEKTVETIPEYKRYRDAIGMHSMKGILMSDVSDRVVTCNEMMLAKGKIYAQKIENKGCKNVAEFNEAFSTAFAAAVYEANGNRLPFHPDRPGIRYKMHEYVDHLTNNMGEFGVDKNTAKILMKNPALVKNVLADKQKLKEFAKNPNNMKKENILSDPAKTGGKPVKGVKI